MTTKREKKDEPKAKRPKLKKETIKDLSVKDADKVGGGVGFRSCNAACANTT